MLAILTRRAERQRASCYGPLEAEDKLSGPADDHGGGSSTPSYCSLQLSVGSWPCALVRGPMIDHLRRTSRRDFRAPDDVAIDLQPAGGAAEYVATNNDRRSLADGRETRREYAEPEPRWAPAAAACQGRGYLRGRSATSTLLGCKQLAVQCA